MAQQLKRWESPRRKGRNDKGRGGSARQRQLRKQYKALRKKLKQSEVDARPREETSALPFFNACLTHRSAISSARRYPTNSTMLRVIA